MAPPSSPAQLGEVMNKSLLCKEKKVHSHLPLYLTVRSVQGWPLWFCAWFLRQTCCSASSICEGKQSRRIISSLAASRMCGSSDSTQPCSAPTRGTLMEPRAQPGLNCHVFSDTSFNEHCRKPQPAPKDRRTALGKLGNDSCR